MEISKAETIWQCFAATGYIVNLAPQGIFFDHDNNPTTDAKLVLFRGVPPTLDINTTPVGWYTGFEPRTIDGIAYPAWTKVDDAVVTTLLTNPLYTQDVY